jgi:hypothetical protein
MLFVKAPTNVILSEAPHRFVGWRRLGCAESKDPDGAYLAQCGSELFNHDMCTAIAWENEEAGWDNRGGVFIKIKH